jgi:hypothetical protein
MQSGEYFAIYHMKIGHEYVDWTYLAYDIGQ